MDEWQAFARLPAAERRALLATALLLPPVTALLRITGYTRARRWLGRVPAARHHPADDDLDTATMIGRAVTSASRHNPVPSTCLSRSLVAWLLLRRRGIEGDLRLGVAKPTGHVRVHAWVELRGVPINDRPDVAEHYAHLGP